MILIMLIVSIGTIASACRKGPGEPSGKAVGQNYDEAARTFYIGLAALQVGDDARAEEKLTRVTELVPEEPTAWADLGLLSLRRREFDVAAGRLERALALAPKNSSINLFLGLLDVSRERTAEAIKHLKSAIESDSKNVQAMYALSKELEKQSGDKNDREAQRLLERIIEVDRDNLAVVLELARMAAKRGDAAKLLMASEQLAGRAASWTPEARQQFDAFRNAASGSEPDVIVTRIIFLRNVLVRVPEYRNGYSLVQPPPDKIAEPISRLILLPAATETPAPPDIETRFAPEPLTALRGKWNTITSILLREEWTPSLLVSDARTLRMSGEISLAFPGGTTPPGPDGILGLDYDYDFQTDIAVAGASGFRLYRQSKPNQFTDVTAKTALPAEIVKGNYASVWAADLDSDGDLDIILGSRSGPPLVLNNNGDGTFRAIAPFQGVDRVRGFAWTDLDADGDPDAVLLNADGQLYVFSNERLGRFHQRAVPQSLDRVAAIASADLNNDGILDLAVLSSDGTVFRLSDRSEGQDWDLKAIAKWEGAPDNLTSETSRLFAADLDNNGAIDLVATGPVESRVWLSDEQYVLQPLAAPLTRARIFSVADVSQDGRLDLLGLTESGEPVQLVNRGQREYQWKEVRTRAKQATGDQRINPFGIGGEVEIRSGLLVQKQPIAAPLLHFGLGKYSDVDVVRIIWPNGSTQAEFDLKSDIPSTAPAVFDQRLEGSCPFLFAYDGEHMQFVTDLIWRSPLGLRINAQDTATVSQTEDWVKVRRDQLAAVQGFYEIRITAELWETHFFDHVSLMAVDHPIDTDVFVDERFVVPPPALKVYAVAPPQPVARAVDDTGRDVTEIIRARDGRFLDSFGRGQYQGVTRDHYVEIDLGDAPPRTGPLWLIAYGWVHPTDSSINVALSQGHHPQPQGLSLEVIDHQGRSKTARSGLGFPAGKNKTILINLEGLFEPGSTRRLRLRTNLEVFWDSIEWATGLTDSSVKLTRIQASSADLHYRGFSKKLQVDDSSPELPDYNSLASTAQRRRDLIGYHTRFGDVSELVDRVDDRYVIMNAGDEMTLRFPAPAPPPAGWVRDFVVIADGWEKDGNYNTTFSKTVLPLPWHNQPNYSKPPGRLEDDPAYRRHPGDWFNYHTRYITPESYQQSLRLRK